MVAQSGGPTAVINASLVGVLTKAKQIGVKNIYGALYGVEGLLKEKIVNLNSLANSNQKLQILLQTPACALGSCRKKLKTFNNNCSNYEYEQIAKIFKKFEISTFFYIGGNDSMDTVLNLSNFFKFIGLNQIKIIGIPKTIDNDLEQTDHCPGFASAAKFVATTFLELERDCSVYNMPAVTVVEVMGRNTGWLTMASALSRLNGAKGPNLIYCCEREFNLKSFLVDVEKEISNSSYGGVLVAVSEGLCLNKIEFENFNFNQNQESTDDFGHKQLSGIAKTLQKQIEKNFHIKTRSIELNLMQRCASHIASRIDVYEAKMLGEKAVYFSTKGLSGIMTTIKRINNKPYMVNFDYVDVKHVANKTKKVPTNMLMTTPNVSEIAINYLKPLIDGELETIYKNGLPLHFNLK